LAVVYFLGHPVHGQVPLGSRRRVNDDNSAPVRKATRYATRSRKRPWLRRIGSANRTIDSVNYSSSQPISFKQSQISYEAEYLPSPLPLTQISTTKMRQ